MKMNNTMSRMKQVWAIGAIAAGLIVATIAVADSGYPSQQQVAFAKQTNDLMFAAVLWPTLLVGPQAANCSTKISPQRRSAQCRTIG